MAGRGLYLLGAFGADLAAVGRPRGRMIAGNPHDINLFAWFIRYGATAVAPRAPAGARHDRR